MFRTLILARDSDTASRLCVYLPLLWGPSGTEPGALASVEGPGPGGSKVRVQVGLFGQVRRAFSGCHLTPGLSQCCPFSLPLSLPLSVDFFHFRHSGSSVHSSFLMYVLVLHPHSDPFLAATISPAGTLYRPRTILAPCRMSFPFTLPSPARSPLSHLLQIFSPRLPPSLCSLFTPHTLSPSHPILSCPPLLSSALSGSERPQS